MPESTWAQASTLQAATSRLPYRHLVHSSGCGDGSPSPPSASLGRSTDGSVTSNLDEAGVQLSTDCSTSPSIARAEHRRRRAADGDTQRRSVLLACSLAAQSSRPRHRRSFAAPRGSAGIGGRPRESSTSSSRASKAIKWEGISLRGLQPARYFAGSGARRRGEPSGLREVTIWPRLTAVVMIRILPCSQYPVRYTRRCLCSRRPIRS